MPEEAVKKEQQQHQQEGRVRKGAEAAAGGEGGGAAAAAAKDPARGGGEAGAAERAAAVPATSWVYTCLCHIWTTYSKADRRRHLPLHLYFSLPPTLSVHPPLCVRFVYTLLLELGISFVNYKEICCCTQRFVPCACVGVRRVCFAACVAEGKEEEEVMVGGC